MRYLAAMAILTALLAACTGETIVGFVDSGPDGASAEAGADLAGLDTGPAAEGGAADLGDAAVADMSPDGSICAGGWKKMITGTTSDLYAVWGTSAKFVFAAGAGGTLLVFQGLAWSPVPVAKGKSGVILRDVWGTGPTNIFAVGSYDYSASQRKALVLRWNGTKWSGEEMGVSASIGLRSVWGTSTTSIFAVGNEAAAGGKFNAVVATFDGSTWAPASISMASSLDRLRAVWSASATASFAVGGHCASGKCSGTYYKFNGTTWEAKTLATKPPVGVMTSVWGTGGKDIWVVGRWSSGAGSSQDWAVASRFDGTSWTSTYLDKGYGLNAVWGSSTSYVYAVGDTGKILKNTGNQWTLEKSGSTNALYDVWGSSGTDIFAVGAGGTILRNCQ